ncbi:MAG: AI-2E family transporter [Bacteroidetes bacterium]|nr:MAG: AI-2E family transporter [Bacteroidota bacterium]TAG92737.1 MAG: AI-2E family transporter [Bacteroidota bacterium]
MQTKLPFSVIFTTTLLGIFLFFGGLIIAADLLVPLAFAFIFSLTLYPLVVRLEKRGISRFLSVMAALLVVLFILAIIFLIIYQNILTFSSDLPEMKRRSLLLIEKTQKNIETTLNMPAESQLNWLKQNSNSFLSFIGKFINNLIASTTNFLSQTVIVLLYIYFMLYYRHVFKGFIVRVVSASHRRKAIKIELQIIEVTQKYLIGLLTVMFVVAILNVAGLLALGIPHAIFFGTFAALLIVIPFIGVFIGSALPVLFALIMTDSLFYPVAIFVWFQIVQALEGNIITPNIVGSQISLNPLVAILALLIGASVWGIAGMVLFTPFTAMVKVIFDNIPSLTPYGYLLGQGEPQFHKKNNRKKGS